MSWTSNGFFRNTNILNRLDETTGTTAVDIYQPGTLNPRSLDAAKRYSGFITSLRLFVDIRSIAAVDFPTLEGEPTEGEINAQIRSIESTSPKKQLNLLLRKEGASPVKIASILLFNRRPYYSIDLLLYYTDAAAFDVASDTILSMQFEAIGFGVLEGQDLVSVHGSAVEEAENSAPSLVINVTNGGFDALGNGEPIEFVTADDGSPVTDNNGSAIVITTTTIATNP